METQRRATVYLRPQLHRALKLKAAETDRTLSDLINEAVRQSLAEDALDLQAIQERKDQPERPFEAFLAELRKDGLL